MDAAGALAMLKLKPQKFMLNNMIFESIPGSAEPGEAEYAIWEKWSGKFCKAWGITHSKMSGTVLAPPVRFSAYTIPVQVYSSINKSSVQGFSLPNGSHPFAFTTQLSACSICWERRRGSLTLAHILPDKGQGGGPLKTALEGGQFSDSDTPFNVFGVAEGPDYYDRPRGERCNVIGVEIRGEWALFGQVTSGFQSMDRVLRIVPIWVPWRE